MNNERIVRIALIEDDAMLARALDAALARVSSFSCRFEHSATLQEGLSNLENSSFDVLVLDLSLPDSEGLGAITSIRERYPLLPIIVLTGSEDESLAMEVLRHGAQDYILKGAVNGRSLARSIQYAIERMQLLKDSEEALSRRKELELQSARLDFLAALMHNLKGPVLGADRMLDVILSERFGPLSLDLVSVFRELKQSNSKVLKMINDLISIYQLETDPARLVMKTVSVPAFLKECILRFEEEIGDHKVDIRLDVSAETRAAQFDEAAMSRVIENLLDNAVKYGKPEGVVNVKACSGNEWLEFSVKNSGKTITEEEKALLFGRFWQGVEGHNYSPIAGFGLYFCRTVVNAHDGELSCVSEDEFSNTFTIRLPTRIAVQSK